MTLSKERAQRVLGIRTAALGVREEARGSYPLALADAAVRLVNLTKPSNRKTGEKLTEAVLSLAEELVTEAAR